MSGDRIRVAAYALSQDEDGRVLLCHIAPSVGAGDVWTLPGGGLDFGEPPVDAVLRELEEETGYRGEVVRLVDVSDRLFQVSDTARDAPPGTRMHAIRIVYEVRITGGEPRDELDGSTDMCRWFQIDETSGLRLTELARRAVERARTREASGAQ